MDISNERLRQAIPTSKSDLFDFVNTTSENLKSIGIEPHNSSEQPAENSKETNNNHLMMSSVDMSSYGEMWPNIDSSMLEELNCWTQEAGAGAQASKVDNTDGAIYTLTVLNGAEQVSWFKQEDAKEEAKLPTSSSLDLDLLLNGMPVNFPAAFAAESKAAEFTFDEGGFVGAEKKEEICTASVVPPPTSGPGVATEVVLTNAQAFNNNNEWKQENNNEVDSLLRNALQGKSLARYNGIKKEVEVKVEEDEKIMSIEPQILYDTPSLIDSDNPSSAHSMEDMFLSHLDVSYPEDYEKLKRIETEVAESVEQFCLDRSYITPSGSHQVQVTAGGSLLTLPVSKPAKKYTKRAKSSGGGGGGGGGGGSNSAGSVRKERSLHYCNICSKGFKDKYSVNVHIRTHTGEKPFTCSLCGKSFRQKAHLAKHYQTHMAQAKNGIAASSQKSNKNLIPSS